MGHSSVDAAVSALAAARPRESPRVMQAVCALACVGLLGVAAFLRPDPRGLGTHEQLHLPPCTFQHLTGLPCPGCGMTTAFAATVRLQFGTAFMASPFGMLLAAGTLAFGVFSLVCLATGSRAWRHLARLEQAPFLWTLFSLLLASWVFKLLVAVLHP